MKPLLFLAALAVGTTGCFGGSRRPFARDCAPDYCPPSCPTEAPPCQTPKAPCAPEQPTGIPAPTPPPPTGLSAPAPNPVGMPGMMPVGAPMMPVGMPVMGFGAPAPAFQAVNAQVRERTGLGFALDFIRIPIPCLKPIAVQRPSEVTFQMQQQQQQQFSGMGFAPMPMGFAPQPMGFAPMPMGFAPQPMGFAQQPVGMVPHPTIQYGQVTVASQVPVGQVQQPPTGVAPVGVAPPPKSQQDLMLEECQRKLEESQRKLKELEKKNPEKKEP